jgi:hypothetical protein
VNVEDAFGWFSIEMLPDFFFVPYLGLDFIKSTTWKDWKTSIENSLLLDDINIVHRSLYTKVLPDKQGK